MTGADYVGGKKFAGWLLALALYLVAVLDARNYSLAAMAYMIGDALQAGWTGERRWTTTSRRYAVTGTLQRMGGRKFLVLLVNTGIMLVGIRGLGPGLPQDDWIQGLLVFMGATAGERMIDTTRQAISNWRPPTGGVDNGDS